MDILAKIAEQRIREAMERGEFDNLPATGSLSSLMNWSACPSICAWATKFSKTLVCCPKKCS